VALRNNYMKNVMKSIAYSAVDTAKQDAPEMIDFAASNKDAFVNVYKAVRHPTTTITRSIGYVKNSKIYQAADYGLKNAIQDLKTGKFYNKEREAEAGKFLGIDADDMNDLSEFGIDDNWEDIINGKSKDTSTQGSKSEVTAGDKIIASAIEGSNKAVAGATVNAVMTASDAQIKNMRTSVGMIYNQNERLIGGIHNDISVVNSTMGTIHNLLATSLGNMDKNMSSYFTESIKLDTERNSILKEMLELQKQQYTSAAEKEKQSAQKNQKSRGIMKWSEISSSGMPDIDNYFKNIKTNINKEMESLMPGMGGDSNMLMAMMTSPLRFITDFMVKAAIPATLKEATKELNGTISNAFATAIGSLGNQIGKGGPLEMVAKIFGINTNVSRSIDTSKYEKGPIPFDGITRKAIIEVIPAYLRRIESVLSSNPERIFDYNSGKFTDARAIRRRYDDIKNNAIQSATADVKANMTTGLNIRKAGAQSQAEIDEINQAMLEFQMYLYNNNGIFNPNATPTKNDVSYAEYPAFYRHYKEIADIYKNSAKRRDRRGNVVTDYSKLMNSRQVLDSKAQEQRIIDSINSGVTDTITTIFQDESTSKSDRAAGKWTKIGDSKSEKWEGSSPLLQIKDEYGNSLFNYLQNINKELIWARVNGGVVAGTGGTVADNAVKVDFKNISLTNPNKPQTSVADRQNKDEEIKRKAIKNILEGKAVDFSRFSDEDTEALQHLADLLIDVNTDTYNRDMKNKVNSNALSKALNEKLYGGKFITRDDIEREAKKAEKETNELETPEEKNIFTKISGALNKYGSITAAVAGGMTTAMTDLIYAADKNIYEIFYRTEIEGTDQDGDKNKYSGFMEMLIGKTNDLFTKAGDYLKDTIFDPLKEKLGLGDDFKDRFTESLKDQFIGLGKMFVNANKEVYGPVYDKYIKEPMNAATIRSNNRAAMERMTAKGWQQGLTKSGELGWVKKNDALATKEKRDERLSVLYSPNKAYASRDYRKMLAMTPEELEEECRKLGVSDTKIDELRMAASRGGYDENKHKNMLITRIERVNVQQHAKGTFKAPFKGITMLSKGEQLYGVNGDGSPNVLDYRGTVPKTGAYGLGDYTHIYNPKGLVGKQQDLGREELMAKRMGLSVAKHAGGSIDISNGDVTVKDFLKEAKQYAPEALAGGATGGALGMVVGGPLFGAALGAGVNIIRNSTFLKDKLFGKLGEDGKSRSGGIISKDLQDTFKKYFPDMVKYGLAGIIPGMLTPLGPIGGLLVGGTIGLLKNNETFMQKYFGEGGSLKLSSKETDILKQLLPGAAKGAAGGAIAGLVFGGPFGLVGNMAIGAGLGMMTTTDEFKDMILGIDVNGVREGGLVGFLSDAFEPLTKSALSFKDDLMNTIEKNIILPLNKFTVPAIHALPKALGSIPRKITEWAESDEGLAGTLSRSILGVTKAATAPARAGLWLGKKAFNIATSPLKLFGVAGDRIRGKAIERGEADYMTAAERIEWQMNNKRGNKVSDFDRMLANIGGSAEGDLSLEDAKDMVRKLEDISDNNASLTRESNRRRKEIDSILNNYRDGNGNKLSGAALKQIRKHLDAGEIDKIPAVLQKYRTSGSSTGISEKELESLMEGDTGLQSKLKGYVDIRERKARAGKLTEGELAETRAELEDTFKNMGLKVNLGSRYDISKLVKNFNTEITNREAGNQVDQSMQLKTPENVADIKGFVSDIATKGIKIADGEDGGLQDIVNKMSAKFDESLEKVNEKYDAIYQKRIDKWFGSDDRQLTDEFKDHLTRSTGFHTDDITNIPGKIGIHGVSADFKYKGKLGKARNLIGTGIDDVRRIAMSPLTAGTAAIRFGANAIAAVHGERKLGRDINKAIRNGETRANLSDNLAEINQFAKFKMRFDSDAHNYIHNELTEKEIKTIYSIFSDYKYISHYFAARSAKGRGKLVNKDELAYLLTLNMFNLNDLNAKCKEIVKAKLWTTYDSIQGVDKISPVERQNLKTGLTQNADTEEIESNGIGTFLLGAAAKGIGAIGKGILGAGKSLLGGAKKAKALKDMLPFGQKEEAGSAGGGSSVLGGDLDDKGDGKMPIINADGEAMIFKKSNDGSIDPDTTDPKTKAIVTAKKLKDAAAEKLHTAQQKMSDRFNSMFDNMDEEGKGTKLNPLAMLFGGYLLWKSGILKKIYDGFIKPIWEKVLHPWITEKVVPWITGTAIPAIGTALVNIGSSIKEALFGDKSLGDIIHDAIFGSGDGDKDGGPSNGPGGAAGAALTVMDNVTGNKTNVGFKNKYSTNRLQELVEKYGADTLSGMYDENGNQLTYGQIANGQYSKIYNVDGTEGYIDKDGNLAFKDPSFKGSSYAKVTANGMAHAAAVGGSPLVTQVSKFSGKLLKSKSVLGKAGGVIGKAITTPLEAAGDIGKGIGRKAAGETFFENGSKGATVVNRIKGAKDAVKKSVGDFVKKGEFINSADDATRALMEGAGGGLSKSDKVASVVAKMKDALVKGLDNLFNSPIVQNRLAKAAKAVGENAMKYAAKLKKQVSETFLKAIGRGSAEAGEALLKNAASKLNLIVTVAFLIADFVTGCDQAESILGVSDTNLLEELGCGLVNALANLLIIPAVIPGVPWICSNLFKLMGDDLEERQKEADAEYQAYLEKTGSTDTKEEYLKKKHSVTGRIGGAIKSGVKKAGKAIKAGAKALGSNIKKAGAFAVDKAKELGSNAINLAKNAGTAVKEGVTKAVNKAVDYGKYIAEQEQKGEALIKDPNSSLTDFLKIDAAPEGPLSGMAHTAAFGARIMSFPIMLVKRIANEIKKFAGKVVDGVKGSFNSLLTNAGNVKDKMMSGDPIGILTSNYEAGENDPLSGINTALYHFTKIYSVPIAAISWAGHKVSDAVKSIVSKAKAGFESLGSNIPAVKEKAAAGDIKGLWSAEFTPTEGDPMAGLNKGLFTIYKLTQVPGAGLHWIGGKISSAFTSAMDKSRTNANAVNNAQESINKAADNVKSMNDIKSIWDVKADLTDGDPIKGVWSMSLGLSKIGGSIKGIFNMIIEPMLNFIDDVKDKIGDFVDGAKDLADGVSDWVGDKADKASKAYDSAKTSAGNWLNDKWQAAKKFVTGTGTYGRGYSKQIDSSIANLPYNSSADRSRQTIGDSACGPAAAVNVLESFGRGKNPIVAASNYAVSRGYKETDGGTKPGFFTDYFSKNGLGSEISYNRNTLEKNINSGMPTVLMGSDGRGTSSSTPFGKSPHYVTVTGTVGNKSIVQDPESPYDNQLYDTRSLLNKTSLGVSAYGRGSGIIPIYGIGKYGTGPTTINIPAGLGGVHSYMGWQCITSPSSAQYKLRAAKGQNFNSEGFGIIDGRYTIACTTTFGQVGDAVDFYKANGKVLKCIIADIKNPTDKGCNTWGHLDGKCIVEFVVDKRTWYSSSKGGAAASMHANPGTASCHPEWGNTTITKAVCYGSANAPAGDAGSAASTGADTGVVNGAAASIDTTTQQPDDPLSAFTNALTKTMSESKIGKAMGLMSSSSSTTTTTTGDSGGDAGSPYQSGGAASGDMSSWISTIETVKKAIAANNPTYQAPMMSTITINGEKLKYRNDCTGLTSAAAMAAGAMETGIWPPASGAWTSGSGISLKGFTKMGWPGWEGLQKGDIISRNGHAEIFSHNEGGRHMVWNGGSTNALRTPGVSGSSHPSYTTIWRRNSEPLTSPFGKGDNGIKPLSKYGQLQDSYKYGRGGQTLNYIPAKKTASSKESSLYYEDPKGTDKPRYGKGSDIDLTQIINFLMTIADNTDKLNTIVKILNKKLNVEITAEDVANAQSGQSTKRQITGKGTSTYDKYTDQLNDQSLASVVNAMKAIAAE